MATGMTSIRTEEEEARQRQTPGEIGIASEAGWKRKVLQQLQFRIAGINLLLALPIGGSL